jgi:hypothetical protein
VKASLIGLISCVNKNLAELGRQRRRAAENVCLGRASGVRAVVSAAPHTTRSDTVFPRAVGGLGKSGAEKNAEMIQWTNVVKASRTVSANCLRPLAGDIDTWIEA